MVASRQCRVDLSRASRLRERLRCPRLVRESSAGLTLAARCTAFRDSLGRLVRGERGTTRTHRGSSRPRSRQPDRGRTLSSRGTTGSTATRGVPTWCRGDGFCLPQAAQPSRGTATRLGSPERIGGSVTVRNRPFGIPVLLALEDGECIRNVEIQERVAAILELTPGELEERYLQSGAIIGRNRVNWVLSEHYRAGWVERPWRGVYRVAEPGLAALDQRSDQVDLLRQRLRRFLGLRPSA